VLAIITTFRNENIVIFSVYQEQFGDTKRGNQNPYIEEEQTTQ